MVYMQALKNLQNVSHVAINVGQCSVSIATLSRIKYENSLSEYCPVLEDEKHRIQTIFIQTVNPVLILTKLYELLQGQNIKEIKLLHEKNDERLNQFDYRNWTVEYKDKNDTILLARGCNFLLKNIRDEAYIFDNESSSTVTFNNQICSFYPYILVTFDEEVGFVKVSSHDKCEFLGNSSLNIRSLINLAKPLFRPGDVHHTVSLAKLFIAACKGGQARLNACPESSQNKDAEIREMTTAFGLVNMLCTNIGQMATLYAKIHGATKILFGENISDDVFIKHILRSAVHYFSEKTIDAVFLRHDSFISGLGALIPTLSEVGVNNSWYENYCESTGMTFQFCFFEGIQTIQLTMDSLDDTLLASPLLQHDTYYPDTQNLHQDVAAREYWIDIIVTGVSNAMDKAISVATDVSTAKSLRMYKELLVERMTYLNANPHAYGELSMRILQDTMEHMKRETGIITMFEKRKQDETDRAMDVLPERLKYIDSLGEKERQEEVIVSILAGNMFDYSAREVVALMNQGKFDFVQAMEKLPVRPWLFDDLDSWIIRSCRVPYQCAMVFCDNCGFDFILGIVPFIRDLLRKGTKVIICVNKDPVLNDVTYYEASNILERIKPMCDIIRESIEQGKLSVMKISKSTCCVDLSFIDAQIAEKMLNVDLLVIEGMGRTVHTNLHAKFNCETLRIAVVKDTWFSQQLGGDSFACICKYTTI